MKRSPIKPSQKPLKRIAFLRAKPAKFKAKKQARKAAETAHFRRVASLPCACCGIVGYSQCAHSNLAEHGKGLGLKAHYLTTFPLCCSRPGVLGCHSRHDRLIGMTKDEADSI